MRLPLAPYTARLPVSGNLAQDVDTAFLAYGNRITREHVQRVAKLAPELARRFGVDPQAAETAALLHDIGGVVPRGSMVDLCLQLGLSVRPEELQVPMLLHARISEIIAGEVYGVTDLAVLQAIRVHTALHGQPTPLDQVVFLADKIEWDQEGEPPYRAGLLAALDTGLDAGTRYMLTWMYEERARLLVVLPELREAWAAFGVGGQPVP
jgi:predicted HD superfamily hydrolase involved in NAD metabolism